MANTKKKTDEYEVMGKTTAIKFTSRASVCITAKNGDKNFYTVEACEERLIPDIDGVDIEAERQALWNTVNEQCDNQIADILKVYKK